MFAVQVRNDCNEIVTASEKNPAGSYKFKAVDMEAFALLRAAYLNGVRVLAIVKGISDVGTGITNKVNSEILQKAWEEATQNAVEDKKLPPLDKMSDDGRRRLYRPIAAYRASVVLVELIDLWASNTIPH